MLVCPACLHPPAFRYEALGMAVHKCRCERLEVRADHGRGTLVSFRQGGRALVAGDTPVRPASEDEVRELAGSAVTEEVLEC